MNAATDRPADWQELPPIPVPLEDFTLDDAAVHRRALARLVELLEAPITVRGRRGDEVSPVLARLRVDVAVYLLGLVPVKIEDVASTALASQLAERRALQ